MRIISVLLLLTMVYGIQAQKVVHSIQGRVVDSSGDPIPYATVVISNTVGTTCNMDGTFQIDQVSSGEYSLNVSFVGYASESKALRVDSDVSGITITLEESTTELEAVTVTAKSQAAQVREQAYAVAVVEAKSFKNATTDVNQMLNRVAGVNIRQQGGLGSSFSLSLNGLSGNRVRTFINGVPMDYFGTSLTLNNFPANLINSVEIYKGAVPIHLSSDALGGAVNIQTGKTNTDYLDLSYSLGSFNTHRAALNAQVVNDKGLLFRVKSFHNQSDNDYKIKVHLLDTETGKLAEESTDVRRFHDAYRSDMIWAETGFVETKFADELVIGAMFSDNFREYQQNPFATGVSSFPVGEANASERKWIYNLAYRKRDLFVPSLNIASYLVMVDSRETYVDTSAHRYDWFGGYEPNIHPTTGELGRKTLFSLDRNNYLANANAEYAINPQHNLALNFSLNAIRLQGEDQFQPQNNTQYSSPNHVRKSVLGLSYTQQLLSDRLQNTLFTKVYDYHLQSNNADYSGTETNSFIYDDGNIGMGLASTYFVHDRLQLKGSFERAFRFPESYELYGDGLTVIPNPELQAEESLNLNFGLRCRASGQMPTQFEVNTFMRNTWNYIRFKPQMSRSQYINDPKVVALGVDMSGRIQPTKALSLGAGITYVDLRNNDETTIVYKDRIPNEPYLFGNLVVNYQVRGFRSNDQFTASITQRYVHEFFLDWPSLSATSSKSVIPSQYTTDTELVYSAHSGTYNISFLISNAFDAEVYDNFSQQRPGRAFAIKVRYFIDRF